MDLRFHKNHAKWFVTPVMRAIRRYALIEEGDRVCVGLSGGKDSTTLFYILRYLHMNIVQNKKLGSFSPKVVVEGSPVTIIRPMIYLNEKTIASVHRHAGLPLLDFTCPYAQHNVRQRYKETVRLLEESLGVRSLSRHVVSALENVDETNGSGRPSRRPRRRPRRRASPRCAARCPPRY